MKRIYALVVLLGIVMSAVLTGCGDNSAKPDATPAGTNAAPAAPPAPDMPSTNK